ncbi:hypothetical protein T02_13281 [Trichinella nativa]|uniref:Secreted protein n=1 Tax=Trichinella nativa TaxID=6335 RepID=A0A0V1KMD5_9BILA|nr:hypothetical protein T02_13281 [Trichinella nativa]
MSVILFRQFLKLLFISGAHALLLITQCWIHCSYNAGSSKFFYKLLLIDCGWKAVVRILATPNSWHISFTIPTLINEERLWRTATAEEAVPSADATVRASAFGEANASGHFEMKSHTCRMYRFPIRVSSTGPTMSVPTRWKENPTAWSCMGACGFFDGTARATHAWHARHQSSTSSRCWGQ